jgi:hypothetical protein
MESYEFKVTFENGQHQVVDVEAADRQDAFASLIAGNWFREYSEDVESIKLINVSFPD